MARISTLATTMTSMIHTTLGMAWLSEAGTVSFPATWPILPSYSVGECAAIRRDSGSSANPFVVLAADEAVDCCMVSDALLIRNDVTSAAVACGLSENLRAASDENTGDAKLVPLTDV